MRPLLFPIGSGSPTNLNFVCDKNFSFFFWWLNVQSWSFKVFLRTRTSEWLITFKISDYTCDISSMQTNPEIFVYTMTDNGYSPALVMVLTQWNPNKMTDNLRTIFWIHFLDGNLNFDSRFTELCSWWFTLQYTTISSCNGLVVNMRHSVTWTRGGPYIWRHMMSWYHNRITNIMIYNFVISWAALLHSAL